MASVIAAVKRAARVVARIRYRLLLVNVIVAAVPLVGISFAQMHEHQLLAAEEADLIHQAELVRAMVIASPSAKLDDYEAMLAAAAKDTHTRIRLLDTAGVLRADSHRGGPPEGAERPEPHLLRSYESEHVPEPPREIDPRSRREIKLALAGRYGSATRFWDKQGRVYLFSALPILRDGRVAGVVYLTKSTHDVKLQLFRLRTWLFRMLLATIALTALVSLVLATTIARPLDRLTRRAQRIAARQPVEPDRLAERADEIGQLARAVEAMTDELERRARDARTLAADISHEFKTPLTGIRGAAELLRDGATEDPEARDRFLAMIIDDAQRLDRLVSRLLELARVEDDRGVELPVDVDALARASTARPWPRPVEVITSGDPIIAGRRAQIVSALDALIANATQHADPDTTVRVMIERHAAALRVTVANHGPALSASARVRVWDRFYSTRVADGGSGLGLAIVRSVALAHAGAVGVECASGVTAFWFQLRAS
ncbi:MAG: integral rane sensor signal transduction histidine kinase [Myxococcales bacterium]|nr:integral rane sensor signal transduction histidine kinase [Myxococcales bacterium]